MNDVFFPNDSAGVFHAIHFADFGVSWAGPNPFGEGFCFGSETGQVRFADETGVELHEFARASKSRESVNGVAFSQEWLAVTTRKDINLIGPCVSGMQMPARITFFGGGHDVVVAPSSGNFVIPLGPDGLMYLEPGTREGEPITISKPRDGELNFCRTIALPERTGNDVLISASRRGGVAYAEHRVDNGGHSMRAVAFHGLDIVDVCALSTLENSFAVAAAAKDGSLTFFDNILTDKTPLTVKFKRVTGAVYRVLSADGDIYLLTSKGLFCLFGLGAGLASGEPRSFVTEILRIPIEAADANLVGTRWLLAVGTDSVFRFDLAKLPKSSVDAPRFANNGMREQPEEVPTRLRWTESDFERRDDSLALAH